MENLKLLHKHKKRTIIGHALVKFIFIYLCILIFLFTSVYFRNYNEDVLLETKVESVVSVLNKRDAEQTMVFDSVENKILENVYLFQDGVGVIHAVDYDSSSLSLEEHKIYKIDSYKYYYRQVNIHENRYTVIARLLSNNFASEIAITLLVLLFLAPAVYFLLFYISEKGLQKVHNPIEDMIVSLEGFAANINHEFKTSISEILSSLELADITKEYKQANTQAMGSASRLNAILDSLSLMIHFVNSDYRKEKVNIIAALDKSIDDFTTQVSKKRIAIKKKYNPGEKKMILIDKAPLLLCFNNIFKNAIRYSEPGGTIEVDIQHNYFVIKDYGVGIEAENVSKIFERYFRESYVASGSGIGLSLVKRITEIYGWKVDIDTQKHAFTQVTLHF